MSHPKLNGKKPPKRPLRDPLLQEVLQILNHTSTAIIAQRSGLGHSTLSNWRNGKTKRPQALSLEYALRGTGFHIGVKHGGKHNA